MSNAGLVGDLVVVLRKQLSVFEELYALSLDKKGVIVKNDIDALKAITAKENALVGKSQRLEKDRLVVMRDIGSVLGKKPDTITISYLTELIEGQPEAAEIAKAASSLTEILTKIREANDQNRLLVANALDYIDFSINVLRSAVNGDVPSFSSPYGDGLETGGFFDVRQ